MYLSKTPTPQNVMEIGKQLWDIMLVEMLDRVAADMGRSRAEISQILENGNPLDKSALSLDFAANKLIDAAKALHP